MNLRETMTKPIRFQFFEASAISVQSSGFLLASAGLIEDRAGKVRKT